MAEVTEALVPVSSADVQMGWNTKEGFALMQRAATLLAASELVPEIFRGKVANTTIALEMAQRIGAGPLAVMQNLYIVHGKPGWSSQFIIAAVNNTGRYSPIRFAVTGEGDAKTCIAWAIEKATGERLESPPVSIAMAKAEGWYDKNGSKWKTMPDLMLRYRSATFFGRLYAPEILMGMKTEEEIVDITPPEDTRTETGRPAYPAKGVEGLKATLGLTDPPFDPEKKDTPPASSTPPGAGSTEAGAPGTASASPTTPPAEREPGADEDEVGLPFGPGSTEKAPADSADIPAYLNRAKSSEDLSVRWDSCAELVAKCSAQMKKAYEKHRDERKKALSGGGAA